MSIMNISVVKIETLDVTLEQRPVIDYITIQPL